MAEVDAFGKVFYETISANKLSASRVDRVKSYAVRCFHESSLLVKMILKCHKKASKSTKVSSLYLFDAVARHAGDVVRKQGKGFDPSGARALKQSSAAEAGSTEALVAGAKIFLSTAQLAAQEICLDTIATVGEEQKEKVKKVVDFWSKANTFDQTFLSKLQASLASSTETSSSRSAPAQDATVERSTTPSGDPQQAPADASTLLETLSGVLQGLRSGNTAIPVPSPAAHPTFDISQLGALQQLTAATTPVSTQPSSTHLSSHPLPVPSRPFTSMLPAPPPSLPPPTSSFPGNTLGSANTWEPSATSNLHRSPPPSLPREAKRSRFSLNENPSETSSTSALRNHEETHTSLESKETLANFDMSTFDPTKPVAWQDLADKWKNTYGYMPSNQELMMCMMVGAFPPVPGASNAALDGSNAQFPGTQTTLGQTQQRDSFSAHSGRPSYSESAAQHRGPSETYTIPTSR